MCYSVLFYNPHCSGTKFEDTKDFEIDWLIFSGKNLFAVECGVIDVAKLDTDARNVISKKLRQIKKYQIVIERLLQATAATELNVYYLAVFPSLPFEDIQSHLKRKTSITEQEESLDALVATERSMLVYFVIPIFVEIQI